MPDRVGSHLKAQLGKDLFLRSRGCWQNLVSCSHRTEGFSFLLAVGRRTLLALGCVRPPPPPARRHHGHLLHSSQQGSESASETDIAILCDIIAQVTFMAPLLCSIARSKLYVLPMLMERGLYKKVRIQGSEMMRKPSYNLSITNSEAEMALQSCPELGQGGQVFLFLHGLVIGCGLSQEEVMTLDEITFC